MYIYTQAKGAREIFKKLLKVELLWVLNTQQV